MAENPFFSGRISQELYNRVVAYSEETGESKTQVLRNALAAYVNYALGDAESPAKAIGERFAALESRIMALEERGEAPFTPVQASPDALIPQDDSTTNQLPTTEASLVAIGNRPNEELLNATQMAKLLGCSRGKLLRLRDEGQLPATINNYIVNCLGKGLLKRSANEAWTASELTEAESLPLLSLPDPEASLTAEEATTSTPTPEPMMLTMPEIHNLPGLENWERKKLTKKLNNVISQTRRNSALGESARASITIDPYIFEEIGKQEGRVLWQVSRL